MHGIKKIGIFRALQLGDILCSIPAIRALKSFFTGAEIFLISLPGSGSLVKRFEKYFSGLIPFPGYPGLPEQSYNVGEIADFIKYMQNQHFDLVLQMQGNGTKVNQLIELFAARFCGGFYTPSDYKPPGDLFMPYPDYGHEIERHLKLMNFLGIQGGAVEMEFPVTKADEDDFNKINPGLETNTYVCIHPGSRGSWRQWPPENFARMADLCMEANLTAVITGTTEESELAGKVAGFMKHKPVILSGLTNLGSMAVLLRNSRAIVSNCTGISHMAAALKIPGVIISMDGEPDRWAPLDSNLLMTFDWLKETDTGKVEDVFKRILRIRQAVRQENQQVV